MDFWIVASLAAFFMGLSKGGMPIIAMLSVPLMALIMDPALAAGLLLPIYIVADWYTIYLFRKAFSVRNLKILIPAAFVGVVIGFLSVSHVPANALKLLLAAIGIYFVTDSVFKRLRRKQSPARPADVPRGAFWGTVAGLTSYIAHSGGPPYQVYILPQKLDKMTYLGTTAILFACINLMKVGPYIWAGQLTWDSFTQSLWLAPMALFGAWSGARISKILPERIFYLLIETALGLMSLKLLYEGLTG
ncbi:sulfite exporter TauE/SafE family protein [Yoonia sp. BS5-3]|uniref:Probable membrane transporter protein n=1 Tax=Yoonia phaeophyticola TaxID=3137369 RepID=A0ABZ2V6J5_9RHOB